MYMVGMRPSNDSTRIRAHTHLTPHLQESVAGGGWDNEWTVYVIASLLFFKIVPKILIIVPKILI